MTLYPEDTNYDVNVIYNVYTSTLEDANFMITSQGKGGKREPDWGEDGETFKKWVKGD